MKYNRDIFVITLPRSTTRKKLMSFQLEKLNLSHALYDAVDGSALSQEERDKIERQRDPRMYGKPFTQGEIGCMLSHMGIYQEIITRNLDYALILEDDVFITERVPHFLSDKVISQLPVDWDIILLAYVQRGNVESQPWKKAKMLISRRVSLPNNFVLGKPIQFCYHAAGYLVSAKGARNLLRKGNPLRMPADILTGATQALGMNLYVVSRPIIRQHHEWALHSTIKIDEQDSETRYQQRKNRRYTFIGVLQQVILFFKRLMSFTLNKALLTIRGHGGIVVFLRKLGVVPPDSTP